MKQLILVFSLACLSSCETSNNRTESDGNTQSSIDVLHQKLSIEIHPEEFLTGTTTLYFMVNSKLDTLALSAADMDILTVAIDNKNAEYKLEHENQKLVIIPNGPIAPRVEMAMEITYKTKHKNQSDPANIWGSFGKGVRFFKPSKTEKERRLQAWAFGEPESAKYWFPCHEDPADLRTTEITIIGKTAALSNGHWVNTITLEEGVRTTFKEDTPYPVHHTFFVMGTYHNYQQSYDDVTINNYGYPDEKTGTKESVVSLPEMMKFYSEYTGLEYPYPFYSQIFVQDFGGWKPGLANTIITENMIDDKTTHEDFLYGWDLTEGEAMAAQWFGSYLKPKSWNDVWLSKGFSRYFSGLYTQKANGKTEFLTYHLSPDLSAYFGDWNSGVNTSIVRDSIQNLDTFVNSNAPYAKASRVLHMLRKELGEKQWKAIIKMYVEKYGGQQVSTAMLLDVVNHVSEESMDWFFKQWVFGIGHPKFKADYAYDRQKQQLTLEIFQVQNKDSVIYGNKIPFFKGKMRIELDDGIKEIEIAPKSKNSYTFSMQNAPKLVNIDFEDTWIKEMVDMAKSPEQLLGELQHSEDALHRVTVMRKLTKIAQKDSASEKLRSTIKTTLGNSVLNEKYWRMRVIALGQLAQLYPLNSKGSIVLDNETETVLLKMVEREESWAKAWTINFLGNTLQKKYVPLYLEGLKDYSDRVVFMSAIALGKTKDPRAYDALMGLHEKPSWKNQSLISAMYGLKELQDKRAYDFTLATLMASEKPHWNLGTPIWDHRLAAAHTLVALDSVDQGYDLVYGNFKDALANNHYNDIFYNAQLVAILGDKRGAAVFEQLQQQFKEYKNALTAIAQLQQTFENSQNN